MAIVTLIIIIIILMNTLYTVIHHPNPAIDQKIYSHHDPEAHLIGC